MKTILNHMYTIVLMNAILYQDIVQLGILELGVQKIVIPRVMGVTL